MTGRNLNVFLLIVAPLLQLFFRALADGEKSLFYKSLIDSKTRELDSGATSVESLVFLGGSPHFPAEFVGFSGIPGSQLTEQRIEQLRSRIVAILRLRSEPNLLSELTKTALDSMCPVLVRKECEQQQREERSEIVIFLCRTREAISGCRKQATDP